MRLNSKRHRRAVLRKVRRRRRRDLRWMQQAEKRNHIILSSAWPEPRPTYYNRAAERLNKNLRKPSGGHPICDGSVICPICGKDWLTFGDPDCWTRNYNPARLKRSWDVTGYWPGTAQCCGLLLAPDFEQQSIVVDESAYKAATTKSID